MAGFGYGANLSGVVCWDSKTFWRRPWESRPKTVFLREKQCHPQQLTAVLEGVVYLPEMGLDLDW